MDTINIKGLPVPIKKAIETMVLVLSQQFLPENNTERKQVKPVVLPVWQGNVIGHLTREEIYSDE